MKQSAPSNANQHHADSGRSARAAAPQGASASSAPLTQLVDAIDASPAVRDMTQFKADMLNSPRLRASDGPAQHTGQAETSPNHTGLPDDLKTGVEAASGMTLDNVRVHYNSPRPAELDAHAYTQGTAIHVAPGQEQHLPHEAWHVVQQAQGRVRPTMQMKANTPVNDDADLEREADIMGATALKGVQRKAAAATAAGSPPQASPTTQLARSKRAEKLQRQREQLWPVRLAGKLPAAEAREVSALGISIVTVEALLVPAWQPANQVALIRRFRGDSGNRTAADWNLIAQTLVDQEGDVATFARIPNGWNSANLETLADLFLNDNGGLTSPQWAAIATALADPDIEADVAEFARIPNGWTPANLATLAGLFHTDDGGQSASDWAAMAASHVNFVDQDNDVALIARITNWTVADLAAMCAGGWTSANLAMMLHQAVTANAQPARLEAMLGEGGFPASSLALTAAGWTPTEAGQFLAGALSSAAPTNILQALLATGGFANAAVAMIGAGWNHHDLGTTLGHVLNLGTATATLYGLLITAGFPASSQLMLGQVAWTPQALSEFFGHMLLLAAPAALQNLLAQGGFPVNSAAMLTAGWGADQLGDFSAHALQAGLQPADLNALTATGNFPANSFAWFGGGWTPDDLGDFAANALLQNFGAAPLTTFMGTANAAANAHPLIATWAGALNVGLTVGYVRVQGGPPTDPELVTILDLAEQYNANWTDAQLRNAALAAGCGPPNWNSFITQAPNFEQHWVGGGSGNAAGPDVWNAAYRTPPAYQISLTANVPHIESGHTYEYFNFTYANCMRGAQSTLFNIGEDSAALVTAQFGGMHGMAEQRAWANGPLQNIGGYRVGILGNGPSAANIWPMIVSQFYRIAGNQIQNQVMVAYGRARGHF